VRSSFAKLLRTARKAVWPPEDIPVENRIFLVTTLLAWVFALFVFAPTNFIQGLSTYHQAAALAMGGIALVMWVMARSGRQPPVLVFIFVSLVLIDLMYFTNGASTGVMVWIFPVVLVFSIMLLRGWPRFLLVLLYTVNLPFLFLTEAFEPEWVIPYPSDWARLLDQLISVPLVTLMTGFLVLAMTRALDDERRRSAAQESRLEDLVRETGHLALTDGLTGLLNQRALRERLRGEMAAAVRHGHPLSLIIIDLDHFKSINDRFGHQAGDEAICRAASCIKDSLRLEDIVGRYGGEEFMVILPHIDAEGAFALAEKIRQNIQSAECKGPTPFTLSAGAAERQDESEEESLFRRADRALYRAKHLGRNRVVLAEAMHAHSLE
jgi:diguanylate cyclase (GGDEF)-like protein